MKGATAKRMVQMTRPCVVLLRTLPVHVPSKRLLCRYLGFLNTRMTESPLKNSLLINLSLFTGLAPFLPLPVLGTCTTAQFFLAELPNVTKLQTAQIWGYTKKLHVHKQAQDAADITSVHISFTFSSIMLQCRSNALTRPKSFLLFRQLINTCELLFTLVVSTDKGPVLKASSSRFSSSSTVGCVAIATV